MTRRTPYLSSPEGEGLGGVLLMGLLKLRKLCLLQLTGGEK